MAIPYKWVKFAKGSNISEPLEVGGACIKGIVFPSDMTGTSIGFQVSLNDGVTYYPVYDANGNLMSLPFVSNALVCFSSAINCIQLVKLVSLHADKPTVETNNRLLGVVLK